MRVKLFKTDEQRKKEKEKKEVKRKRSFIWILMKYYRFIVINCPEGVK